MPDVVVVGAGPAGSTLAYTLAKQGVDVVVVEKKKFPRDKPCGGGVDAIFFDSLPVGMDISSVVQDEATTTVVRYQGKNQRTFLMPEPIVMTQRSELDFELLKQAELAGAKFVDGVPVTEVKRLESGAYQVVAGPHTFFAPIVVGADGAYSVVAKATTLYRPRTVFVAAEWDVHAPAEVIDEWKGKTLLDFSVFPLGYSWIFAKREVLNIGFGLPKKQAKNVHILTGDFAQRLGWDVEKWGYEKSSHWIPFALPGSQAVEDGIVLVGDAAGMADPTTGAGISWGVRSSGLAAYWILEALSSMRIADLQGYQDGYENMLEELAAGVALRNFLILNFALRHQVQSEVFMWALDALSNKTTYREWAEKHPVKYKMGKLIQRFVVERLI